MVSSFGFDPKDGFSTKSRPANKKILRNFEKTLDKVKKICYV